MLKIGEFARLAQVSPRALRYYASLGLLAPASVDPSTGYRYYDLGQLVDLQRRAADPRATAVGGPDSVPSHVLAAGCRDGVRW